MFLHPRDVQYFVKISASNVISAYGLYFVINCGMLYGKKKKLLVACYTFLAEADVNEKSTTVQNYYSRNQLKLRL